VGDAVIRGYDDVGYAMEGIDDVMEGIDDIIWEGGYG
jgi:hypothetical protein